MAVLQQINDLKTDVCCSRKPVIPFVITAIQNVFIAKKTEVDFQIFCTEILQSPLSAYVFILKKGKNQSAF
jgi:hypothetical protein